jgi:ATP-dependent RNA helicase DeaD
MAITTFADLQLSEGMLNTVADLGYEAPTDIQVQTIRLLIEGRDVIAQAQTGTGKTAAFAIPIVECVEQESRHTQALVLAPTRELAVQVAEAIHRLGHSKRLSVLPVYGGQPIERQLHALRRGVQVVIGTPGRVMDHLRRGTLVLTDVKYVVLDEADEMLDMGFLEDIESILESVPAERQMALFSATIPPRIADLAQRYLRDPVRVMVQTAQMSVPKIEQFYVEVMPRNKLDALTRLLDHEEPESAMIFARTKRDVDELGESLQSRGFDAETLHGDLNQTQRDRVLQRFRSGQVDLLVATQVAARGLDITGVTHVFNYAIPEDAESYVHRIGRTGRAGKEGKAITLVQPNEVRWLRVIERIIGQKLAPMRLPTLVDVEARRREAMKASIREKIAAGNLLPFMQLVTELTEEFDLAEIAAAAAKMASDGERPLTAMVEPAQARNISDGVERGMVRLVLNVGREAGVRPGDIVGAIANEANLPGRAIGAIDIYDRVAFVEVPVDDRDRVIEALRNSTIRGRKLQVEAADGNDAKTPRTSAPRQSRSGRATVSRDRDGASPTARSKPGRPTSRPVHGKSTPVHRGSRPGGLKPKRQPR